jgi:hypothetical protein
MQTGNHSVGFQEKRQFFAESCAKIVENSCDNIGPSTTEKWRTHLDAKRPAETEKTSAEKKFVTFLKNQSIILNVTPRVAEQDNFLLFPLQRPSFSSFWTADSELLVRRPLTMSPPANPNPDPLDPIPDPLASLEKP